MQLKQRHKDKTQNIMQVLICYECVFFIGKTSELQQTNALDSRTMNRTVSVLALNRGRQ